MNEAFEFVPQAEADLREVSEANDLLKNEKLDVAKSSRFGQPKNSKTLANILTSKNGGRNFEKKSVSTLSLKR